MIHISSGEKYNNSSSPLLCCKAYASMVGMSYIIRDIDHLKYLGNITIQKHTEF